ncbi:Sialic acid TRAP transporter permease protein SiaT (plasmid) [Labrenzia sp. THAF191b]|uniref:TRAP transporter large permease n=1 Tax=unclassified Labrenzia TaxID=2648686 RepID=UPI001267E4D3|nr:MULTISPECIES: TRAP transporter large permease [unclassified Labrenzia]QFT01650.1 Sialic acid TRAP transporter permease protein SiaT [Labrenzia sp. THAF191b]QFT07855.1 Sialic acid TRAP transporter permease protein SiaT [Labrenzia sp. THAF191a]QFT19279.1 Sialic acid TRAP transporter permease protein SiaT [Labrenzia sp. THAF187b]
MLALYLATFLLLIAASVPIAFALGLSTLVVFWIGGEPLPLFAQRLWTGLDKFTLVAIPLFILAGELMGGSGILQRLLDFARLLVGRIKGSLLYINILVSMFFGGINGSAIADTSAVGSMMIKATEKEYGDAELAAATTAVSSVVGPIIPPSLTMLIFAFAAGNVSIAALFLAGIVPGILLGTSLLAATAFIVRRKNYPVNQETYRLRDVLRILGRFMIAAVLPIIMVGGIVGGIATPTEAGCLAIVYAVLIGFFVTRELTPGRVYEAMKRTVIVSAVVMVIIAFGNVSTWWLTIEGVPKTISMFVQGFTENPHVFMALMLVIFLLIGLFVEQAAAIVMLVPIFAPLAVSYGIDPVHFGLFTCLCLALGLVTPPVGLCLFVSSGIAGVPVHKVFSASIPYLVAMAIVLLLVTFVPQIFLWLPRLFGF